MIRLSLLQGCLSLLISLVTFYSFQSLAQPATPILHYPLNNATNVQVSHTVAINDMSGFTKLEFEYDTDATFGNANGDRYSSSTTTWNSSVVNGIYSDWITKGSLNIKFGKTYYLRVRVYNASEEPSDWSNVRTFSTVAAPMLHTPTDNSTNIQVSHTVAINDMSGINTFEFEYDTDATFGNANGDRYSSSTTTWNSSVINGIYSDWITKGSLNIKFGKTYYLRVRVYNASEEPSDWSNVRTFSTVAAPTLHSPTDNSTNIQVSHTVAINAMSGINTFEYEYDTDATFGNANGDRYSSSTTTWNSSVVNGIYSDWITKGSLNIKFGKTYYLRVRVNNASDDVSDWSNVRTFSTVAAPTLHTPTDNSTNIQVSHTVAINAMSGINMFEYEYDTDATFDNAYGDRYSSSTTTWNSSVINGIYSDWITKGSLNIKFGKTYYLRVRVYNASDNVSDWSNVRTFSTIASPTLHTPSSGSINIHPNFTVAINSMPGISKLEYEMDTNLDFNNNDGEFVTSTVTTFTTGTVNSVSSNYFTRGPVKFGKQYYLRVRAYNQSNEASNWSNVAVLNTIAAPVLSSPSNNAINISTAGVALSWTDLSGESGYEVQMSTNNLYSTPIFNSAQNGVAKSSGALVANTTYYWRVRAKVTINSVDYYSAWAERSFATGATTATLPPAPTLTSPGNNATGQATDLTLIWSEVADASYRYELSKDQNFITDVSSGDVVAGSFTASVNSLDNNARYYWRVRAISGDNGSAWSSVFSFSTGGLKSPVTVSITDNEYYYDGSTREVTVTTNPTGITHTISYSQSGNVVPNPSQAGIYDVLVEITDSDYELSGSGIGSLIINKVELTVTADSKTKTYGEENPALTFNYTGFVNGEDSDVIDESPSIETAATQFSDVNVYPILLSGGTDNNYTFSLTSAELTIQKAALNVTADAQTKVYGGNNPSLTFQYDGFVGPDDESVIDAPPNIETTAQQFSNVGNYPITLSNGTDNNYTFNFVNGTFSVAKANLFAIADSKSRTYGQNNPELTISYQGFVGTDNTSVIDTEPTAATTATNTSNAGNYEISLTGGSDNNYDIILANGTLTVTKANQEITFNVLPPKDVDDPDFELEASSSSMLEISFESSDNNVASIDGTVVTIHGEGSATITASQPGNENYEAAPSIEQVLVVTTKQEQTITFTPIANKTIGDAPFMLEATSDSGLPVTFQSSNGHITINGSEVTINSSGSVTITATQSGNDNYKAATPSSQTICINPVPPTISIQDENTVSPTLQSSIASGNQWYRNGEMIIGATDQTLQLTDPGNYTVAVTVEGCTSSQSTAYSIVVTDAELPSNHRVHIYPNPASEKIIIEAIGINVKSSRVLITDLQGRSITTKDLISPSTEILVADFSPGLYFATIQSESTVIKLKFVKK